MQQFYEKQLILLQTLPTLRSVWVAQISERPPAGAESFGLTIDEAKAHIRAIALEQLPC